MRIVRIRSLEVDCVCCVVINVGEFCKILLIVCVGGVGVGVEMVMLGVCLVMLLSNVGNG